MREWLAVIVFVLAAFWAGATVGRVITENQYEEATRICRDLRSEG